MKRKEVEEKKKIKDAAAAKEKNPLQQQVM